MSYSYSLRGELTGITYPTGLQVTRTYDDAGRLVGVLDSQTGRTTTFSPDADGNTSTITYPNSTTSSRSYDNADVLTGITDTLPSGTTSFGYGRDADNQVSSSSTTGAIADSHTYGYTSLNQLNQDNSGGYTYDLGDNITGQADGTQQRYDAANELVSRISIVGQPAQLAPSATTSVAVPLPSGIQAGDAIVLATTQSSTSSASTPAGYTAAASVTSTGTPATTTQLFTRRATGAEAGPTLAYSVLSTPAIVVAVYRGVDPAILDAPPTTGSTPNGTGLQVAGPTTQRTGDRLVLVTGASGSPTPQTWTAITSGLTPETPQSTQRLASSVLFDSTLGAPDAVPVQKAVVSSSEPNTGVLLALRPLAPTYDARGNRTATPAAGGSLMSLGYDQANRLIADGAASYTYNGDGLRVGKTVSGAARHFTWDTAEGLPLLLDDGTNSYVDGPGGQPIEQIQHGPAPAISRVAIGSGGLTPGSTSFSVTLSAAAQANDQILVSVTEQGNDTATVSGYTEVTHASTTTVGTPTRTTLLRRTATGGETSVTVTLSGVAPAAAAEAVVYRGVDPLNPTGPIDGPSTATTGSGTGTSLAVGGVTATYPGEFLVLAQGATTATSSASWSNPTPGMTERALATQALAAGAMADQPLATAGSTGARTMSYGTAAQLMGIMVALRPAQPVLYYLSDQLGSTRILTDSVGVVRAAFTFDPYGNLSSASGTATTPLLFNGQYLDTESGFYYLRARYYEPTTGQFLSRDPAVGATRSPYGYVGGNPLNATDPTGLFCWNIFSSDCQIDLPGGNCIANGAPTCSNGDTGVANLQDNLADPNPTGFVGLIRSLSAPVALGSDIGRTINGDDVSFWDWLAVPLDLIPGFACGAEVKVGDNLRFAPLGNRGPGRFPWPHYHRRGIDPSSGATIPGQGIGRHRPWDTKSTDSSFWNRF